MGRLDGRATWQVSRAHLRAHSLLQELFADAGARAYHYRLLAALEEAGAVSQAELGRVTGLDRSDVSVALSALEEGALIVRAAHPTDRRRNLVSLTARGRDELARLDAVVERAQALFLAPLAEEERDAFLDMITRLGREPGTGV
ncbi:MarR family transcriptional regulator [Microbacterium sp. LWH11-1.2]|uniref:MarR family winged helix-turn-helix transcriptional regulator n=1 Tax=unclassified Microbacterium TaxID=2609290 RepID=UPI0031390A36